MRPATRPCGVVSARNRRTSRPPHRSLGRGCWRKSTTSEMQSDDDGQWTHKRQMYRDALSPGRHACRPRERLAPPLSPLIGCQQPDPHGRVHKRSVASSPPLDVGSVFDPENVSAAPRMPAYVSRFRPPARVEPAPRTNKCWRRGWSGDICPGRGRWRISSTAQAWSRASADSGASARRTEALLQTFTSALKNASTGSITTRRAWTCVTNASRASTSVGREQGGGPVRVLTVQDEHACEVGSQASQAGAKGPLRVVLAVEHDGVGRGRGRGVIGPGAARTQAGAQVEGDKRLAQPRIPFEDGQFTECQVGQPEPVDGHDRMALTGHRPRSRSGRRQGRHGHLRRWQYDSFVQYHGREWPRQGSPVVRDGGDDGRSSPGEPAYIRLQFNLARFAKCEGYVVIDKDLRRGARLKLKIRVNSVQVRDVTACCSAWDLHDTRVHRWGGPANSTQHEGGSVR